MDPVAKFIHAMKTPINPRLHTGDVVTVIGKFLAWTEPRRFPDDPVALDHEAAAVVVLENPFSAEQGDNAIGAVVNGDEINEGVRLVLGQTLPTVVVNQLVEAGGEPWQ